MRQDSVDFHRRPISNFTSKKEGDLDDDEMPFPGKHRRPNNTLDMSRGDNSSM